MKYTNKPLKDDSHITLAQVEINDIENMNDIKEQFVLILKKQLRLYLTYEYL